MTFYVFLELCVLGDPRSLARRDPNHGSHPYKDTPIHPYWIPGFQLLTVEYSIRIYVLFSEIFHECLVYIKWFIKVVDFVLFVFFAEFLQLLVKGSTF